MTPNVISCLQSDDVRKAALLMQDAQLRLVVDGDGGLVGIVSLGDLALQTGDEELAGRTLEVSEPASTRESSTPGATRST